MWVGARWMESRWIENGRRRARDRAVDPRLAFLVWMLAIACGSSLSPPAASAATVAMLSDSGDAVLVGDYVGFDILLQGEQSDASTGPGEVTFTLEWGAERLDPTNLGALELLSLPTVVDPSVTMQLGSGCSNAVGSIVGACDLTFTVNESIAPGGVVLASLEFVYLWVVASGYELCDGGDDTGCVAAGQQARIDPKDPVLFGAPGNSYSSELGTFGSPQVRPIPEPATAIHLGIGLAFLSRRSRIRA